MHATPRWLRSVLVRSVLVGLLGLATGMVCFAPCPARAEGEAAAGSWPQFLGPDRNGISTETGLIDRWPQSGLKTVWRAAGGVGMSGMAIDGGQLVTMVQDAAQQYVLALDAQTGKPLWKTPFAPAYKNQMGDGPRATPTLAGTRVFAYSGQGILAALNRQDGTIVWTHDVVKEQRGKPAEYGMACSPLVTDNGVIVIAGAPQATVVAYDPESGKMAWTVGTDSAGYSSPAVRTVAGRRQVVTFTGDSVIGIEPGAGTLLWRYPYVTDYKCNIATPLAVGEQLFISSGENHGCALLSLQAKNDSITVGEVWSSQGAKSVMRNEWQTSILLGEYLYGFDNVGSAGPVTHLACIHAPSGKPVWQQRRFGKGNLIAADGKLFLSTMKGELVVVRATPEAYQELGRQTLLETTRQAPALAAGLLYLRDGQNIVCVDVRGD